MAEYIDKALLKELLERYGCDKDLLGIVACIPAEADVMQVVRCKDCKYRDGTPGQPNILCAQMHEDDFCSYGERKDGKDEKR